MTVPRPTNDHNQQEGEMPERHYERFMQDWRHKEGSGWAFFDEDYCYPGLADLLTHQRRYQ